MSDRTARLRIVRENSWERGRSGMAPARVQVTNCVFHNDALRPATCPFPKHPVLFNTILNTGDKAPFSLLVISRKEKGKLIQTIQILVKNLEKILASRVPTFTVSTYLSVGLLSHFLTSAQPHAQSLDRLCRRQVWSRTPLRHHAWQESASWRRHAQ